MRRWRTRSLVIFGAIAALYSDKLQDWWVAGMGWDLVPDSTFMDAGSTRAAGDRRAR